MSFSHGTRLWRLALLLAASLSNAATGWGQNARLGLDVFSGDRGRPTSKAIAAPAPGISLPALDGVRLPDLATSLHAAVFPAAVQEPAAAQIDGANPRPLRAKQADLGTLAASGRQVALGIGRRAMTLDQRMRRIAEALGGFGSAEVSEPGVTQARREPPDLAGRLAPGPSSKQARKAAIAAPSHEPMGLQPRHPVATFLLFLALENFFNALGRLPGLGTFVAVLTAVGFARAGMALWKHWKIGPAIDTFSNSVARGIIRALDVVKTRRR